jgi:hypothetical protein
LEKPKIGDEHRQARHTLAPAAADANEQGISFGLIDHAADTRDVLDRIHEQYQVHRDGRVRIVFF